jgi:hypothetical protein
MENREQQILSEIKSMMSSIRIQLEKLDAKMAELQQVVDPEDMTAMPIDLDIDENDAPIVAEEVVIDDDLPFVEEPVAEPLVEPVIETPVVETPVIDVPVVEAPVVEEQAVEETAVEEPAPVEIEPEPEPLPEPVEEEDDDLPLFAEPKPIFEAAIESPKVKKAVIDVMTEKEAWRTDMVGSPVRDLLSAISLNDRVQFINALFQGDPVIFQQVRAKINAMTSLDEVVDYVTANFNWDMSSQVVYRFMMAVRRKVQA